MTDSPWPASISIVIPARDAKATLDAAVQSALAQAAEMALDVVIAVDPTDDATGHVARRLAAASTRVRVVDNPTGTTPAALNAAVAASSGDVVVRLDAHAELPRGYVAIAIEVMQATGAANVGGRQIPTASDGFAAAVAAAMRSPLGSGGATYRSGRTAGPVETVYLGVYRREALMDAGGFDERLLRNQDYELNHRLREAGWQVWFDPRLAVIYHPRDSVRALARQYRDYGRYKRLVMSEHPSSIRIRQLAPVAMVLGVAASVALGLLGRSPRMPALVGGGYVAAVTAGGVAADRRRPLAVAVAIATMHWSWAVGFLQGPPRDARRTATRCDWRHATRRQRNG